jgi:hypothetical protein
MAAEGDDMFDFTDDGMGMGMPLDHEPRDPREMAQAMMMAQQEFYIKIVGTVVAFAAIRAAPYIAYGFDRLFKR